MATARPVVATLLGLGIAVSGGLEALVATNTLLGTVPAVPGADVGLLTMLTFGLMKFPAGVGVFRSRRWAWVVAVGALCTNGLLVLAVLWYGRLTFGIEAVAGTGSLVITLFAAGHLIGNRGAFFTERPDIDDADPHRFGTV